MQLHIQSLTAHGIVSQLACSIHLATSMVKSHSLIENMVFVYPSLLNHGASWLVFFQCLCGIYHTYKWSTIYMVLPFNIVIIFKLLQSRTNSVKFTSTTIDAVPTGIRLYSLYRQRCSSVHLLCFRCWTKTAFVYWKDLSLSHNHVVNYYLTHTSEVSTFES